MKLKGLTEISTNKREYSRISTLLPFGVRVVPPEEEGLYRAKLYGEPIYSELSTLPEVGDAHLSIWLKTINAKLDAIMRMLAIYQEGFQALPTKPVTLSGNGMDYLSEASIPEGSLLEIKMILFSLPPVAVQIYGQVLSCTAKQEQNRIGLKFLDMDDHVRDEIVRFVFEREREALRAKRGEKDYP